MGSPLGTINPLYENKRLTYGAGGAALPPMPTFGGAPTSTLDPVSQARLNIGAQRGIPGASAAGGVAPATAGGGTTGGGGTTSTGATSGIAKAAANLPPGAAPGTQAPVPTLSNVAGTDPNLQYQIDQYKARLGNDVTQRATDAATSQIRDAASGMAQEEKANLARRGILDSGAGQRYIDQTIMGPAQRQIAKAAADIQLGRQSQLDALVLGGTGLMGMPGQQNLANRQLGLQQWQAAQQNALGQGQLQVQQQGLANQNAQAVAAAQQAAQAQQIQQYIQMMNLQMQMAGGGYY